MATPMRSNSQDASHRSRVADPRTTAKADTQASNFEYDDNEWDIGIGNLIIDLDADIEKTNEGVGAGSAMATNANTAGSGKTATKMAIEHSATVDKGLKMKIKRTKPGTKTSEAKHEIVKSNEQNGNVDGGVEVKGATKQHPVTPNSTNPSINSINANTGSSGSKRGSSGHRRDKTRDKHTSDKPTPKAAAAATVVPVTAPVTVSEVNGVVRVSASQPGPQRPLFPSSTGPGPPSVPAVIGPPPGQPSSPTAVVVTNSTPKIEPTKTIAPVVLQQQQQQQQISTIDERSTSPPPTKKLKSDLKEVTDVCIGTSVGTITEPDCLGPCEPGTSVTLEGIVWHETEGGVLVVNVTWRGKTYVGTLLDCTRHDWAPPRFCDSPTSDLDSRTPKGRGKRGRAAGAPPSTDLSNFTETRSSVHSKLRNGGIKGRRGAANGSGSSTAPSSPTPFVPPRPELNNKRKNRPAEEEPEKEKSVNGAKKAKVAPVSTPSCYSGSPPLSPVLLECPEPNCSKKYKHINGLKYHQSHAHGSADDDDTKDITSMSENDESNIESPSPVTPVKSPDKSQDSPLTPQKKDNELPLVLRGSSLLEVPSQPGTPRSTPPSPETPQSLQDMTTSVGSPSVPIEESKSVVKPSVLRYNSEEFPMGVFGSTKTHTTGSTLPASTAIPSVRSVVSMTSEPNNLAQTDSAVTLPSFSNQLQAQNLANSNFDQSPTLIIPSQNSQSSSQLSPIEPESPSSKVQFKVKPTSALLADDKKDRNKVTNFKKKSRKSPAGSPHPPQNEQPVFGIETSGRDEVQSPAYSDISDDGAPIIEPDLGDKSKGSDKKTDSGQPMSHLGQYGMYPFYGQPPYMIPSVQQPSQPTDPKLKEQEKVMDKSVEKEIKKESGDYQQKVIQQYHYNPYGYMPGYPYNMDPSFNSVPLVAEDKIKEERLKETPSPAEHTNLSKSTAPIPNPIQVPTPGKLKHEISHKEKQLNENHQILKESIEIKSQMNNPYNMYSRQQQSQQREEDVRRFYVYPDQRRKESEHKSTPSKNSQPSISMKHKEREKMEEKKEKEIKHEGVKPTMETQGPPPPPTSQYAYIHPSYMQSPHYGALPFDPNHPVYRGIMVPGPYSGNPYMHPQMPRYHAPEDLSRPPQSKALDMLQHHAQYYPSHKIHELQERAIKSPTPKATAASASPSGVNNSSSSGQPQTQMLGCPTSQPSTIPTSGKQTPGDNKDSRSPPPQRHVHTHHHTHVGLGYPMYPAPYGAAVLASQQAAAVTVINPYPPK